MSLNDMRDAQEDHNPRRIPTNFQPKAPEYVELIRRTSTGYDVRDGETFYKDERIGVYTSRVAALEAVLAKNPDLIIQPLQIDG